MPLLPQSFKIREAFHLFFLKFLAESLPSTAYAVKGGICLRLFHSSPRLSEDLDLDIFHFTVFSLREKIRKILTRRAFMEHLRTLGISELKTTEPKQTETTQRWKIHLVMGGGSFLTRLEFSRRRQNLVGAVGGIPSAELLHLHQMTPFLLNHYNVEEMVRQKILALASPARMALRDLFDMHHLITYSNIPLPLLRSGVSTESVRLAIEKIRLFKMADFLDQVVPFLPVDLANHYKSKPIFEALRGAVLHFLEPT